MILGRFCCMAISLNSRGSSPVNTDLRVRNASGGDASTIINFLQSEGRSQQFFPEYQVADFGAANGLLAHLKWNDVFLVFRGDELVGVAAAWDQREIRRWRVTGYANWLRALRLPFNLLAKMRRMPRLRNPARHRIILSSRWFVFAAAIGRHSRHCWKRWSGKSADSMRSFLRDYTSAIRCCRIAGATAFSPAKPAVCCRVGRW